MVPICFVFIKNSVIWKFNSSGGGREHWLRFMTKSTSRKYKSSVWLPRFQISISKYDSQSKMFWGREQTDCTASCYVGRYIQAPITMYIRIHTRSASLYTNTYSAAHEERSRKGALGFTTTTSITVTYQRSCSLWLDALHSAVENGILRAVSSPSPFTQHKSIQANNAEDS